MQFEFDSGIYKITSPSERVYIGQTYDLVNRFKVYLKHKCKLQVRLYASLEKYGFENHKFEILEYVEIDKLNERERYYQDLYDVLGKKGLNCKLTKTRDRDGKHSEQTILKMRSTPRKKSEYVRNENHIKQLSERMKSTIWTKDQIEKRKKSREWYRPTHETINKMKESHAKRKGQIRSQNHCRLISEGKSNYILDLSTGIYFLGVQEACEAFNLNRRSLCNYLNGSRSNKTNLVYAKETM